MVVHLTRRFSLARLISPRIICATRTQPPVRAILRNLRAISWSRSCQGNEVKYKSCTLLIVYITQVSVSVVSNLLETSGCFWGVELAYQRVPGVLETEVGYTDGHKENPSYQEVCRGTTGHTEALRVKFDPRIVKYNELLTVLWDRMDPTTLNRQGNDRGTQYRSGIYYTTPEQKDIAIASKEAEQKKHERPIVTEIKAATHFWRAEEYHQKYLEKGGQCSSKGDTTSIRCYG
ncbi:unnamed protein product [Ascophyllum nodosum]